MAYQIIIEFPNKAVANEFCGQMSDGFGENFCDFDFYKLEKGTYKEVHKDKKRVFFVNEVYYVEK